MSIYPLRVRVFYLTWKEKEQKLYSALWFIHPWTVFGNTAMTLTGRPTLLRKQGFLQEKITKKLRFLQNRSIY